MKCLYRYNASIFEYPEGCYACDKPELSIYTASPQDKEDQYLIIDQLDDSVESDESESEVDSSECIEVIRNITKSDFDTKFNSVIKLAVDTVNEVEDAKYYIFTGGYYEGTMDDVIVMYYPGKNIGISIDSYGVLVYYKPDSTTWFDIDTNRESGLDYYEDERNSNEFIEITRDEFIEKFNKRIEITKNFINSIV